MLDADKERFANFVNILDDRERRFLEKWLKMMEVAAQHEKEEQLYANPKGETRDSQIRS